MSKVFVANPEKFYYHYPFPVSIVGVIADGRVNFMAAAWHTQLSFKPPLYGVAIAPKRFTYALLQRTDSFSVGFLPASEYTISGLLGRTSGRDTDKVEAFGLKFEKGQVLEVPVLDVCVATYECKVVDRRIYGDHVLYVGEIVGVHYENDHYPDGTASDLLLYLGNDLYTGSKGAQERYRFGREEVTEWMKRGKSGE